MAGLRWNRLPTWCPTGVVRGSVWVSLLLPCACGGGPIFGSVTSGADTDTDGAGSGQDSGVVTSSTTGPGSKLDVGGNDSGGQKFDIGGSAPEIGTVRYFLGVGDGTFEEAGAHETLEYATSITLGDMDADGRDDVFVTSHYLGQLVMRLDPLGMPGESWDAVGSFGATALDVADMDGDGKLDLIAYAWSSPGVVLLRGDGDGTFDTPWDVPNPFLSSRPSGGAIADMDGDGDLDLVLAGTSDDWCFDTPLEVGVLLQGNPGVFTPMSVTVGDASGLGHVVVADFDGDDVLDVVAGAPYSDLHLLRGTGTGALAPAVTIPDVHPERTGMLALDADADGVVDLVLATKSDGAAGDVVRRMPGNGDGTFAAPEDALLTFWLGGLAPAGGGDVIAAGTDWIVRVGGTPPTANWLGPTAGRSDDVASGDLDGDGILDFAVLHGSHLESNGGAARIGNGPQRCPPPG